ncbi:MAG: cytochrome c oxidase subunit 3 [Bacteroidota bacterium]
MHPKKFALWLIIVSIVMIFASMTSAYLVRRDDGNWAEFNLPPVLWASSIVLLLSSVTMHWAYIEAKHNNFGRLRIALALTTLLGALFVYLQFTGWQYLVDVGVYLVGNPSGSFLYVITGLHAFHLISGMVFLLIVLWQAYRSQVNSKSLVSIEMCTTYWHFLDGLWIYLFIFLLINH